MVDMFKLRVGTPVRLRNGEIRVVEKCSYRHDNYLGLADSFEVSFSGDKAAYVYDEQGFCSHPSRPSTIDIVEILSTKEKPEDRPKMDKKNRVMHLSVGDSFCFSYDEREEYYPEYYHVIARLDDGVLAVSSGPNPLTPKYFEDCQSIEQGE